MGSCIVLIIVLQLWILDRKSTRLNSSHNLIYLVCRLLLEKKNFFNDTATTEIYTFPYTTLFRSDAKLADLVGYALSYIDELKAMLNPKEHQRKSTIKTFELVDVKEVAERNLAVRYDSSNGYLGYGVKSGTVQVEASQFDRLLVIRRDGTYQVIDAPEKEFVGKGMLYCDFADKELLKDITFTVIYQIGRASCRERV